MFSNPCFAKRAYDGYVDLMDTIGNILNMSGIEYKAIRIISYKGDNIYIQYYYPGDWYPFSFPTEWLSMTDDELEEEIHNKVCWGLYGDPRND